jgi:hypothetical protein
MLTAHATLRDRYSRCSTTLTLLIMALSVVGLVLGAAAENEAVSVRGRSVPLHEALIGLAAILLFIAVVELIVDWHRRQWEHGHAAKRLAELNALYRRAVLTDGEWNVADADLAGEYDRVMSSLIPIPDGKAAALKALHARKVEVFKRVDKQPGRPVWLLRLEVLYAGLRGQLDLPKETVATSHDDLDEGDAPA